MNNKKMWIVIALFCLTVVAVACSSPSTQLPSANTAPTQPAVAPPISTPTAALPASAAGGLSGGVASAPAPTGQATSGSTGGGGTGQPGAGATGAATPGTAPAGGANPTAQGTASAGGASPTAQGTAAGTAAPGSSGNVQSASAVGALLFDRNCSRCHGIEAQGMIGPALRNNSQITPANEQAFISIIANGTGKVMPAWAQTNGGSLTDQDISNIFQYLLKLQGVAKVPPSTPPPTPTEAPAKPNAPTPEPARPSFPGGPGNAVNLTGNAEQAKMLFGQVCAQCHGPEGRFGIPNPGSDDGFIPQLNPIDETIANKDPKVFARNVDLFVEHGSIPSGNPLIEMPAFGDNKMLTDQQIADLIAFVISLNPQK